MPLIALLNRSFIKVYRKVEKDNLFSTKEDALRFSSPYHDRIAGAMAANALRPGFLQQGFACV